MKKIIVLLFCFMGFAALGQEVKPFESFDFSSGEYSLIGFSWGADRNALADSLGEWYTDDIEVLNEFKTKWVFEKPGVRYACGYHYEIHLCRNGQSEKNFFLNLNCDEIVMEEGYFYFETEQLSYFKNKLKTPKRGGMSFDNIVKARGYHAVVLEEDSLIWVSNPEWLDFEGSFSFVYHCEDEETDCFDNGDVLIEELYEEIQAAYPDEPFELDFAGGSNTEIYVDVLANKSLADRFDLYPFGWKKWKAFSLDLRIYWRE